MISQHDLGRRFVTGEELPLPQASNLEAEPAEGSDDHMTRNGYPRNNE